MTLREISLTVDVAPRVLNNAFTTLEIEGKVKRDAAGDWVAR